MARKLRVEYPGGIYHPPLLNFGTTSAMNRRDRREPILKDDQDRQLFLATLAEACGKTGWQVHKRVGSEWPLDKESRTFYWAFRVILNFDARTRQNGRYEPINRHRHFMVFGFQERWKCAFPTRSFCEFYTLTKGHSCRFLVFWYLYISLSRWRHAGYLFDRKSALTP